MNHLHNAVAALHFVRAQHIQSPNKFSRIDRTSPTRRTLASAQRRLQVKLRVLRDDCPFDDPFSAPHSSLAYAANIFSAQVGNCSELAAACAWYLDKQNAHDFCLAEYLDEDDDHMFVALGQKADRDGKFPTNFSEWDPQAAICDAWADIACLAREYPMRWRARIINWHIMHLDIDREDPLATPGMLNMPSQPKIMAARFPGRSS